MGEAREAADRPPRHRTGPHNKASPDPECPQVWRLRKPFLEQVSLAGEGGAEGPRAGPGVCSIPRLPLGMPAAHEAFQV